MGLFGKPTCGWKDYITVYVAEWENVDVVHDSNQCRVIVDTIVG